MGLEQGPSRPGTTCPVCKGTGKVEGHKCPECNGSGKKPGRTNKSKLRVPSSG